MLDRTNKTEKADPDWDEDWAAPPPPRPASKRKKEKTAGAKFPLPVKGETEEPTLDDYAFIRARFAYSQSSDEFFFYHGEDVWGPVTDSRVNLILTQDLGIEDESELIDHLKRFIMTECPVRTAVMVAGYPAGIHRNTKGKPFLILETTELPPLVKGDWSFINDILYGLLGLPEEDLERLKLKALGIDQVGLFHCWMKWGMESLRDHSLAPGHYLIVMGPPKCGKTLLQEKIISPLLGCGPTDATPYLTRAVGGPDFNADLLGAFHWMISDGLAFKNFNERKSYTENLKRAIANSEQRLHAKYKNAGMVPFCCRLSGTLNPTAVESLPILEEGMVDKLLILTGKLHSCLPNAECPRPAFEARIAAALSGYAYFLLKEFEIPANIREFNGERFGFHGWINPDVTEQAEEQSREILLAEIFRETYLPEHKYSDTSGQHYQRLSEKDRPNLRRFLDLCHNVQSFGHLLKPLVTATSQGQPILKVEVVRRKSNGLRLFDITVKRDANLHNAGPSEGTEDYEERMARIRAVVARAIKT